jgi:hypothetical protein
MARYGGLSLSNPANYIKDPWGSLRLNWQYDQDERRPED